MKKLLIGAVLCILLCGCEKMDNAMIRTYNKLVKQMSSETLHLYKEQIGWYNLNLTSDWPDVGFERSHDSVLDVVDGMIGYVVIPALKFEMPIYHDLREDGFYLNCYSAFPCGMEGAYTELYTDLALILQEGDVFYIHILDEVISYEIGGSGNVYCDLICDGRVYSGAYIVED